MIGHGSDAIGVGHRGAAVFLHEKHGNQGYGGSARVPPPIGDPGYILRLCPPPTSEPERRRTRKRRVRAGSRNTTQEAHAILGDRRGCRRHLHGARGDAQRHRQAARRRTGRPRTRRPNRLPPRPRCVETGAARHDQADLQVGPGPHHRHGEDLRRARVHECGTFDITLATKVAPETVNNFVFLANNHFYDGLKFHRLVPNFVIQGGDPSAPAPADPVTTSRTSHPWTVTPRARSRRPRPGPAQPARSSSSR